MNTSERGSVIFMILIAIMLLAALTYTFTKDSRNSSSLMTDEQASIAATEIITYGNTVANAVQKLKLRGCSDTEISFENNVVAGYTNGTDTTCQVFHADGGQTNYSVPNTDFLDTSLSSNTAYQEWFFPAELCARNIGNGDNTCSGDGIDNEDLILILPWVKKEICIQINNKLGIDNPSGEPPVENGGAWRSTYPKFQGTYSENVNLQQDAIAGCFEGDTSGSTPPQDTYHFFQVLLAR